MVYVLNEETGNGISRVTVEFCDDKYRFDVMVEDEAAFIEFQEMIDYRGDIKTVDPPDEVWTDLLTSEELMDALPDGVRNVKRVTD